MSHPERFRAYIAVYLVLIKDGEILLLRRYNTGYQDGNYGLVSGHLEGGETAKQGILREAKEEADIILNLDELTVVHVMHRFGPEREYFDIYLKAENWRGDIVNMEKDKCDELAWYKLNDLPENMVPEVRAALASINNGLAYCEFGWNI